MLRSLKTNAVGSNHEHLGEIINASLKNALTEMGRTAFLNYQHRS